VSNARELVTVSFFSVAREREQWEEHFEHLAGGYACREPWIGKWHFDFFSTR
jgi:hypothetical protein